MKELPNEIVSLILTHCCSYEEDQYASDTQGRTALLKACLVNKSWSREAQRLLFARLPFDDSRATVRVRNWRMSPAKRRFPIRYLAVRGDQLRLVLAELQARPPSVVELKMTGGGDISWDTIFTSESFSIVKTLSVSNAASFAEPSAYSLQDDPFSFQLTRLSITQGFRPASPTFLNALFSSSATSLRHLHMHSHFVSMEHPTFYDPLATAFPLVARSLQTLSILDVQFPARLLPLLSSCHNLQVLEVSPQQYSRKERQDLPSDDPRRFPLAIVFCRSPISPMLRRLVIRFQPVEIDMERFMLDLSRTLIIIAVKIRDEPERIAGFEGLWITGDHGLPNAVEPRLWMQCVYTWETVKPRVAVHIEGYELKDAEFYARQFQNMEGKEPRQGWAT
ncbi:hypothetical protein T439DRAFT_320391 [Meredithblackwellia eburnea MCA 4105]